MAKPSSALLALLIAVCILSHEMTTCMAKMQTSPAWQLAVMKTYESNLPKFLAMQQVKIIEPKTLANLQKGVDAVAKVSSSLMPVFKEVVKISSMVQGLAVLGPAFAGVGLIFTIIGMFAPPEPDKTQLLMNQMSGMEARLSSQIDSRFKQLNLQNLKSGLGEVEAKIQSSAAILAEVNRLRILNDVPNYNFQVNQFKIAQTDTQLQLNRILMAFQDTASYGAPLPTQFSSLTDGDEEAVMSSIRSLLILLTKAQINYSAYVNLVAPDSADYVASQISQKNQAVQDYLARIPAIVTADVRKYLSTRDNYVSMFKESNCDGYAACTKEILNRLNNKYGAQLSFAVALIENTNGKKYAYIPGFNQVFIDYSKFVLVYWIPKNRDGCTLDWQRWDQWNLVNRNLNKIGTTSSFFGVNLSQGMTSYWDVADRWGTAHWVESTYPGHPGTGKDPKYGYWGVWLSQECVY